MFCEDERCAAGKRGQKRPKKHWLQQNLENLSGKYKGANNDSKVSDRTALDPLLNYSSMRVVKSFA